MCVSVNVRCFFFFWNFLNAWVHISVNNSSAQLVFQHPGLTEEVFYMYNVPIGSIYHQLITQFSARSIQRNACVATMSRQTHKIVTHGRTDIRLTKKRSLSDKNASSFKLVRQWAIFVSNSINKYTWHGNPSTCILLQIIRCSIYISSPHIFF